MVKAKVLDEINTENHRNISFHLKYFSFYQICIYFPKSILVSSVMFPVLDCIASQVGVYIFICQCMYILSAAVLSRFSHVGWICIWWPECHHSIQPAGASCFFDDLIWYWMHRLFWYDLWLAWYILESLQINLWEKKVSSLTLDSVVTSLIFPGINRILQTQNLSR